MVLSLNKSVQTGPHHEEVQGEDLISFDALNTQISRQSNFEFIIESMHFIKADTYVGFYELFIL